LPGATSSVTPNAFARPTVKAKPSESSATTQISSAVLAKSTDVTC